MHLRQSTTQSTTPNQIFIDMQNFLNTNHACFLKQEKFRISKNMEANFCIKLNIKNYVS